MKYFKLILVALVGLSLAQCNNKPASEVTNVKADSIVISAPALSVSYSPKNTIKLSVGDFKSFHNGPNRPEADTAMLIASAVLNSQEFRDSILSYTFLCANNDGDKKCTKRDIPGNIVLDSLYRQQNVALNLILNDCGGGTFGESSKNVFQIESCYRTIQEDDEVLPFTYKYAYHICHEYMHIVGFFHFRNPKHRIRNDDIAEKTGWVAYYILDRWYKAGINPLNHK